MHSASIVRQERPSSSVAGVQTKYVMGHPPSGC